MVTGPSESASRDMSAMAGARIGLIGGASSWLIASDIDRGAVAEKYGVEFIDIELSELERRFFEVSSEEPSLEKAVTLLSPYLENDRSGADLLEAAKMLLALRSLANDYKLNALTLKCFGILESCKTTACLALAVLNDEGIICGCEGDIPALWTMLYEYRCLGNYSFMCNPSSSNRSEHTIDFAHCTIPLKMVEGFRLPSHFESRIGIGIRGNLPLGGYHIIKFSGSKLERCYEASGEVIANTSIDQRCRTQVRFSFASESEFDRFMETSKGNHVILVRQ